MSLLANKNNNTNMYSPIKTPPLPPKPFFLESTYIRTTGNPDKIYEYIYSFLYKYSPINIECDYYNYSINCAMVINHVGIKFQIKMYNDYGDIIIENRNFISRGTIQFIRLHRSLIENLIFDKLISSEYSIDPKILTPISQRSIPMSINSIAPLIKLCKSNNVECQMNGIQILSRLCADANATELDTLRGLGVQEILSFVKKNTAHFEIIDNCNTALVRISRKRRMACVDLE